MGSWVIALVVGAAALIAPASLAQVVLAPTVFATHDLPSNTITTFTVTCPPGYIAASAGIANPAPGTTLLRIRPVGLRAYSFRFGNPVTNPVQRVTVALACRKIPRRRALLLLRAKPVQRTVNLLPGKVTRAAFGCPPNTVPAGTGADLTPEQRAQSVPPGLMGQIATRSVQLHPRGFSFTLRNTSRKAQTVVLYGNCLTVVRAAGARSGRLGIRITTFHSTVGSGRQKLTHACPTGWISLATGYSLRSPVHTVDGAAAIGRRGRWWVTSDGEVPAIVDLQLVCGRLQA